MLDEPLDCANWNTVGTMFPSSSSGEAAAPEVAAAESLVACSSDPPVRLTDSTSTERGATRAGSDPLTRFSSRTRKSWISK